MLKGSPPEFAKLEENKIHSRGDSRRHHLLVFLGDGYTIAVHKLPVTLGENEGLIFGPQLNFHHDFKSDGWYADIKETKFWMREDLNNFLKKSDGNKEWIFVPNS